MVPPLSDCKTTNPPRRVANAERSFAPRKAGALNGSYPIKIFFHYPSMKKRSHRCDGAWMMSGFESPYWILSSRADHAPGLRTRKSPSRRDPWRTTRVRFVVAFGFQQHAVARAADSLECLQSADHWRMSRPVVRRSRLLSGPRRQSECCQRKAINRALSPQPFTLYSYSFRMDYSC